MIHVNSVAIDLRPEEKAMQTPNWLRPGLYGAAVGAIALAVVAEKVGA